MKIWVASYELKPLKPLNSLSETAKPRSGFLMRVENEEGEGFADVHPWPELGDESLEDQLESLRQNKPTPLAQQSLRLARLDAVARANEKSLFANLEIPESHFLLTEITPETSLRQAVSRGFRVAKVKVGRDMAAELNAFKVLADTWPKGMSLRLDFNSSVLPEEFTKFWAEFPKRLKTEVEFIEDPFAYSPDSWREIATHLDVRFAFDRPKLAHEEAQIDTVMGSAFQYVVLKPAYQDVEAWAKAFQRSRLVITSYMDHPVGQMGAAYWAAVMKDKLGPKVAICGLLSHEVYEKTSFSEQLNKKGAYLKPVSGKGIGFDELLQKQDWRLLQ